MTDALMLVATVTVVLLVAHPTAPGAVAAYAPLMIAVLAATRRYRPHWSRPRAQELGEALAASAVGVLAVSAGAATLGGTVLPGGEALVLWAVAIAALCAGHLALGIVLAALRRRGALTSPTLIVGAGRVGHLVARRLLEQPQLGSTPVGFLDKDPLDPPERAVDLPVLGSSYDLERIVREQRIGHVVIAFSTAPDHVLLSLARRCGELGVGVSAIPRLFEVEGARPSRVRLGGVPLVELPFDDPDRSVLRVKYGIERTVATILWLALSPLLAVIALAVRLTMGRPVLHRQERIGRHGHGFAMLKFRTMTGRPEHDGEADAQWLQSVLGPMGGAQSAASGADRTTPLGRFLRRTSLDELPQLWNVVRGDMSLVGPRPERASYVNRLSPVVYRYPERHRVKPGITGWAQVNGLRGRTSLEDRVEWDNYYVENWSPGLDMAILGRTVACVFRGSPEDGMSARTVAPDPSAPHKPRRSAQRLLGLVALAIALGAVTASTAIGSPGSEYPSAADQYVEVIPTATGDRPAGTGAGGKDSSGGGDDSSGSSGGGSGGGGRGSGGGSGGSSGGGGSASGGGGATAAPLSLRARDSLDRLGGARARDLKRVATSTGLGAPPRSQPAGRVKATERGLSGAVLAAASNDEGASSVLVWLLIAVAATTIVGLGAATHERRQYRRAEL